MRVAGLIAALILTPLGAPAAERPFYGTWACAMVADNAVNTDGLALETYSDAGVRLGAEGKPDALKVAALRKNVYQLTYPGGAKARIVMQQPWLFLRSTEDHAYVCLRKAAP